MTTPQTPKTHFAPDAAHAPIFSEPEVVKAVVVKDLDPAKVVPVFSNPL